MTITRSGPEPSWQRCPAPDWRVWGIHEQPPPAGVIGRAPMMPRWFARCESDGSFHVTATQAAAIRYTWERWALRLLGEAEWASAGCGTETVVFRGVVVARRTHARLGPPGWEVLPGGHLYPDPVDALRAAVLVQGREQA